jgi:non-lysosomal glucosylceramidase
MITMATTLGHQEDISLMKSLLEKGKAAFDAKLWNGSFYNFDSQSKVIMADQLCGHWYLRACGFQYPVFPKEKVESAITAIFNYNVKHFGGGTMGAVNGYIPPTGDKSGRIDHTSIQSEECWPGVTYGLAALMIHENMSDRAFEMAGGMNETINKKMGMSFETPEAIYENGTYRSIGYMRPLSIWAMQHALNTIPHPDLTIR